MRRVLVFLVAALVLSACRIDSTVTLKVQPDGSGVITLAVVADAAVVKAAPGLAADLRLDDAAAAGWTVDGPKPTDGGGLQVTLTHPFTTVQEATALLQSINGSGGPLHDVTLGHSVTAADITTTLTGKIRVDGGLDAFADPDVLSAIGGTPYANAIASADLKPTDVVTFTFVADLPGDITANAGSGPAGTTPTNPRSWSVPIDGTAADLATTAVIAQGSGSSGWSTLATVALVALVAWCVAAAGFILFVATARRARAHRRPGG